jgi:hypothetical protein
LEEIRGGNRRKYGAENSLFPPYYFRTAEKGGNESYQKDTELYFRQFPL